MKYGLSILCRGCDGGVVCQLQDPELMKIKIAVAQAMMGSAKKA